MKEVKLNKTQKHILILRSVAVGWILAVTLMMLVMPLDPTNSGVEYTLGEIVQHYIVFGFPGFFMFAIALILALRNNEEDVLTAPNLMVF